MQTPTSAGRSDAAARAHEHECCRRSSCLLHRDLSAEAGVKWSSGAVGRHRHRARPDALIFRTLTVPRALSTFRSLVAAPSTIEAVVGGVHSPVLQAGPSDVSEAVVFVHGNPGPKDDWSDILALVGEFVRAVAPDMPGYGAADKPRDFDYTIRGYGDYLGGVIDQLGVRRAHLVLHDFGGAWGLAWAVKHPEAFASATLIGTGALIDYHWHRYARIWRTPVLGELFQVTATRQGVRLLVGRENPKLPRVAIDRIYTNTHSWATKRAILKLYRATPESLFAAPAPALRALDRPALVLWPTKDPYVPVEQAERQRQAFPSARIELLEGHGHWVFVEDPERVASLVVPFLRQQVSAAASSNESAAPPDTAS
jgi:pimeloyl-ACP methyl ester carboxylesterase